MKEYKESYGVRMVTVQDTVGCAISEKQGGLVIWTLERESGHEITIINGGRRITAQVIGYFKERSDIWLYAATFPLLETGQWQVTPTHPESSLQKKACSVSIYPGFVTQLDWRG